MNYGGASTSTQNRLGGPFVPQAGLLNNSTGLPCQNVVVGQATLASGKVTIKLSAGNAFADTNFAVLATIMTTGDTAPAGEEIFGYIVSATEIHLVSSSNVSTATVSYMLVG